MITTTFIAQMAVWGSIFDVDMGLEAKSRLERTEAPRSGLQG